MSNSVIKADNIIKKYGRNYALVGVSVEIEKGRIYGLLGRNGAGKSTLMNIITNRVFATSGRCTLDGEDLLENDKAAIKKVLPKQVIFPDDSACAVLYANAFPIRQDNISLKRIQINLTIKEWKVN